MVGGCECGGWLWVRVGGCERWVVVSVVGGCR